MSVGDGKGSKGDLADVDGTIMLLRGSSVLDFKTTSFTSRVKNFKQELSRRHCRTSAVLKAYLSLINFSMEFS